jgi:ABC-2 type transport system ATP-binding protein
MCHVFEVEMNAITLRNVCKSFGSLRAVDGLSAVIPQGSTYGFLGPNGAGKTTTIRMIMNIIRPDSGDINIFENSNLENAKSQIGYMPEERGLYRKMTLRRTLAYFGAIKSVPENQLADRTSRWLKRMELSGWADRRVEELSRGMHQKLQFAVTAINEPQLLVLDEPFSGLDPINQEMLKEIFVQMRQQGKTIIFSTHDMHEAEQLCDSILLINKGKIVLDGQLADIRAQFSPNVVTIEVDGDTDFIKKLPIVTAVEAKASRLDITLSDGADPQQLIRALVDRVRVRHFELKAPSLHEIFLSLVGKSNEQDS